MKTTKGLQPIFENFSSNSSVANLDPTININSLDGTTVFRYNGKYTTTASGIRPWGYGETLPAASTGAYPTLNNGSPLLGTVDDSVKFNGGVVYQADNATFADITTEDFCIEGFFKTPSAYANEVVFSKYDGSTAGYMLLLTSGGYIRFYVDGTQSLYYGYNTQYTLNTWYYFSIYYDASETSQANGMQIYINALNNTAYQNAYTPSDIGSITNTSVFSIGVRSDVALKTNANIAYLAMAKRSNWFAGGATNLTDWAAFHQERFHQLAGIYPDVFKGTPTATFTRSTPAFLRKSTDGNEKYYHMGAGWPRIEKNKDANGNLITGLLEEASGTNYCLRSMDINSWTKSNCTTPSSITGPLGFPSYACVESTDGGVTTHYIQSTVNTLGDTNGKVIFVHFIIAPKIRKWVRLRIYLGGASVTSTNINTLTGDYTNTVGTISDIGLIPIGSFSGEYFNLIWVKTISNAGAGSSFLALYPENDAANISYQGNGSTCFYVAQAQLEIGTGLDHYSSPIITTTASVTHATDSSMTYTYSNTNNNGAYVFDVLKRGAPSARLDLFKISDGGGDTDKISGYLDTDGDPHLEITTSSVVDSDCSITSTTTCSGMKKRLGFKWGPSGTGIALYDYHTQTLSSGIDSSSISIPSGLDTFNAVTVLDGNIGNFKLFDISDLTSRELIFK